MKSPKPLSVFPLWAPITIPLMIAVTSAVVLSGCGMLAKPRREGPAATAASESQPVVKAAEAPAVAASFLNLRVVGAGPDAQLPDPQIDLKSERKLDAALISGDEIQFTDNLLLGKPQFFVWDEKALGSLIKSVTVDYRLEDEANRMAGKVERKTAYFESHSGRWYLPFSELVDDSQPGADPACQHLLTLDLGLADGTRRIVSVRFRVVGAVPRLKLSHHAAFPNAVGDRILKSTEVTNPLGRPVRLWVRNPGAAPNFVLRTLVGQVRMGFIAGGPDSPQRVGTTWFHSDAALQWGAVRVSRNGNRRETLFLVPQKWTAIELGARETLTMEWLATSVSGNAKCALPAPSIHKLSWWSCGDKVQYLSCVALIHHIDEPVSEPWVTEGATLTGAWSADIQASNPWERQPTLPLETIHEGVSLSEGPSPSLSTGPHSCQGEF
jgi:hypothetical protein